MRKLFFTNGDEIICPEEFVSEWVKDYRSIGELLWKNEPLS